MTIVVTSISPSHSNVAQQHLAIKSWNEIGKCYSLNRQSEIDTLRAGDFAFSEINFIPTERTIEHFCGRPLVSINAILDLARHQGKDLLITNSDIIIRRLPKMNREGVTIFSRYDYTDSYYNNKIFPWGFDVFYIPKHLLNIFPPFIYGLGAAWWDMSVPFHCIQNNIPVFYPQGEYAFHKIHSTQYSMEEWHYIGNFFKWEFKFDSRLTIEQVAQTSLSKIKNYVTR